MRTNIGRALPFVFAVAAFAVTGCGGAEQYGESFTQSDVTAVSEIFAAPASYEGRTVKVEGDIVTECPSGCWLELRDGSEIIYIDLGRAGIAIPQRVGKSVTVEGVVTTEDAQTKLLGKGVEIR